VPKVRIEQGRFWRQLVSWLATFAVVLHGMFFGVAAGQFLAATSDPNPLGLELCLHEADGTPESPKPEPIGHSDSNITVYSVLPVSSHSRLCRPQTSRLLR
jgi:hypothetical protein